MTTRAPSLRPVVLLSAAAFASSATARVADPLLPLVSEAFHSSVSDASVVATNFTLAYGLCQIIYGPIGDRLGKYPVIATLTLLSAIVSAWAGFAVNLTELGWLRLVGGATAAAIIPLSMAYIGDTVTYDQRQAVLARFLSGLIIGVIAGQAFGGTLGEHLGWRGAFIALSVAYLAIAIALCLELFSGRVSITRSKVTLTSLAMAFSSLVRSRPVQIVLATAFIEGMLFWGSLTFLGAFIRWDYGLDFTAVGALLASFGGGALLYSMAAPRLVSGLGQRRMVLLGGFLMMVAFASFPSRPPLWLLPIPIALAGLGFYLMHNTLQTRATQMAPEQRGLAMSLFASNFFLGQSAGIYASGKVVENLGYGSLFVGAGILLAILAVLFSRTVDGRRRG